MLGKLMKHEWKETAKLLLPLNLILILLTVVGVVMLHTDMFQSDSMVALSITCTLFYTLSILALFIITAVYLLNRYYRTMFSRQGYLTHTLPVSESAIVNTKFLVSGIWILIAMLITVLSIFSLIATAAGDSLYLTSGTFKETFGLSGMELLFIGIVSVIVSSFSMVAMFFASISIGQLFHQHRIAGAVIAYIVLYIIQQIIGTVLLTVFGFSNNVAAVGAVDTTISTGISLASFYRSIIWSGIAQSAVFGILFYLLCLHIAKKRLNLA